MDTKDARNSLKDRLINNVSPRPDTGWPNVSIDPATIPRFEVDFEVADVQGDTLAGNEIYREIGIMNIVVCVAMGDGENSALDYADDIRAAFPEGLSMTITGGKVKVIRQPLTRGGFIDRDHYRVPVVIRYEAKAN